MTSHPTVNDNLLTKNLSLKEEFSQLLDFPREDSYKAYTEDKSKPIKKLN